MFIIKSLELVHANANNNWCLGLDGNTQLLEITFSKYSTTMSSKPRLPHTLDHTNNVELPEISLEFR